jgi:phospholipid transport system substrate-binding protein
MSEYTMKHFAKWFVLLLGLVATTLASAEELAPDALVNKITAEVLAAIQRDRDLRAGNRTKVLALAEEKVLPYLDFARITRLALGRYWRSTNADQQAELTREFRSLLIRTYSSAIRAYEGQTLVVEPLRMTPGETDIHVHSRYLKPGNQPVPVEYAMEKLPEGWKVYDIIVDNVSLVTTYRGSFSEEIGHSGIAGLILKLKEKNHQDKDAI